MTGAATFTVAVFQDAAWAARGIGALLAHGFDPSALSLVALDSPEARTLCNEKLGGPADAVALRSLGQAIARGPLVAVLGGHDALAADGLGAAMRRAGFQPHDGFIFETLTGRGGVLVAVMDERRAADALATFHAYGGGNAAIGAWTGRL